MEITWEEVAAFWGNMAARFSDRPDSDPTWLALLQEVICYRLEEARMARVEMSRWSDDGGRI
jgi:hypothetical protein